MIVYGGPYVCPACQVHHVPDPYACPHLDLDLDDHAEVG